MRRTTTWLGGSSICLAALALTMPACHPLARAAAPTPVPESGQAAVPAPVPPPAPSAPERQTAAMPSLAPLVKELRPAVVNIYTTQNVRPRRGMQPWGGPQGNEEFQDFFEHFFGGRMPPRQEMKRQALGSGFLVGGGRALTNNHVIDGADEIRVKLEDGREFAAKLVGRDPSTDVALLQLEGDGVEKLPAVRLGDSDGLEVGDYVVAIGNPFGLSMTVTSGIVSAKERVIGAGPYDDFIQTDASINPGNSGGPLFNLKGEVVGINTAIVAKGQGIGFAVPVNIVRDLLPQLQTKGRVARGWLGVGIQEITPELARTFGIPPGKGALISQVFPNGPAAKAGLQGGDVVLEFNGRPVDSPGALSRAVAVTPPGGTAPMRFRRDGKESTTDVTVAEREDETASIEAPPKGGSAEAKGSANIGVTVSAITPELARRLGIAEGEGLAVTDVHEGSAAEKAGVQAGDVLLEFQRQRVPTIG
ncbi:MAG: hypothetical protein RL199_2411, partial [Pseudomonadota bacterium]